MQNIGGLQPEYKNYDRQKCFVGHSLGAEWCEDLQNACAEILPKFNLEPWYAADHFTPTQTLRDKVVELIANSRFGIYDISSWKDRDGNWQLPRNVYIELGIAIALNRPTLLLRHTSNQDLQLPTCLQGIKILEFAGDVTLKKALEAQLPQWIDIPPDRDWLNRFCIFGNQVCSFREKHPRTHQWGQENINCHISDGLDKNYPCYHQSECDEIRGVFEEILNRYSDLTFNYLDEISIADNYQYLLCSHCQTVRSTPFAIYRILPNTSAETFIAIGISIALEKLFEYNIPKVILVKNERDLPSLLRGYEVVEAVNSKEIKQKLKNFLPTVLKMVRKTIWQPRLLPFAETIILYNNLPSNSELKLLEKSEEEDSTIHSPIEEITDALTNYLDEIEEYVFENFGELSFEDGRHPKDQIDHPDEIDAELISVAFGEAKEKSRFNDTILFEIAVKMTVAPLLGFYNSDMSYEDEDENERIYLETNSLKLNEQECVIPVEVELVADEDEGTSVNIRFMEDSVSLYW